MTSDWQSPEPALAALRGLCPRCGASGLFRGAVRFSNRCGQCGLDYDQFNVGDGPAAFLIMIVGAIITVLAIALELSAQPPFWVHILLWLPLTIILVLMLLRVAKGLLLALEYKNRAKEGQLAE
jgi:uncharacterized protein (DUF983 family)